MTKDICLPMDVELTAVTFLKAGKLNCMYEAGKLRYIRCGETELVRMIYAAVRNDHWATLPNTIEDERITVLADSFSIQFTAVYFQVAAVYKADFSIEGSADNRISFSMKGEALDAFKRNRIGICVHHPIDSCKGKKVEITQPDGSIYDAAFPEMVSPYQPFVEIKQMKYTTAGNTILQFSFEGDIFETEDQRNWSDSSYKTYSTPQRIPFPVNVQCGDKMQQQVTLSVFSDNDGKELLAGNFTEEKIHFPKIGYSRSARQNAITGIEKQWLQKIPFHHYRVMLQMHDNNWQQDLNVFFSEATELNTLLELVVIFTDEFNRELDEFLLLLKGKDHLLFSMLPLQQHHRVSPLPLMTTIYPLIKKTLPGFLVGYGTDTNFVELNRSRPPGISYDFVSYGLHPQAHMNDTRSVLENLDNQPDMIKTASSFTYGKPVFVSPVTLKDRYDGAGADKRQYSSLTAWWTMMSIQQLAFASSITFFELTGDAGLLKTLNNKNGEIAIQTAAVYELLTAIHSFKPVWIIKQYAGKKMLMQGLTLENAKGDRLFFRKPEALI